MPPIDDAQRQTASSTVIPLPALRAKFRLELLLEGGLVASGALAATVMALGLRGYTLLQPLIPAAIVLVTSAVALRLMRVSLARLRLTETPDGAILRVDAAGLVVPVTLLLSHNVLQDDAAARTVRLPWARISSWTVHPARQGARRRSPAHHEVIIGEGASAESFYISREDLGAEGDAALREVAAAHSPHALDVRDPRLLRTPPATSRIA
ncbi:MAG: hypothetical protein IT359_10425 [Gemmatimonadaceae bacterium]|nr:hypothetical protein [Gemmatimonadaceae bacterium]